MNKMSYNDIEDIMPISQYHNNLCKQVDDAEWMGEEEQAYVLQCELDQVKRMIDNGELYYAKF
tara:strand:- start:580 stop:768 length:189 start_codon:yes stop_codon:yes gene_type:complete